MSATKLSDQRSSEDDRPAPNWAVEVFPARSAAPGASGALARRRGAHHAVVAVDRDIEISGWFLTNPNVEIRGIRAVKGTVVFVARRKHLRPEILAQYPDRPDALFSGFRIELRLQPGWNELDLQYKDDERKWHSFCRCHIRLPWHWRISRRYKSRASAGAYEKWLRSHGDPDSEELRAMGEFLDSFPRRPLLSILLPTYNTPEKWMRRVIESVQAQVYPAWELCIADDCSDLPETKDLLQHYARHDPRIKVCLREENGHISRASNSALDLCTGEFSVLLDHDDELPPHALFHVAWELVNHPEANIIFSDEDKIDERGVRSGPYFKPGWNYDLLLGQNCVSHLGAFRTSLLREVGGFRPGYEGSQDWDLTLRSVVRAGAGTVRHIPRMLYHWRTLPSSTAVSMDAKPYAASAGFRAVEDHLRSTGSGAEVVPLDHGNWRILWPLPGCKPLVSLIVPTKDHALLLRNVLESHCRITDYPRVEVILVDHESCCQVARDYIDGQLRARNNFRILSASGAFNWSRLCNLGARKAAGDVLVFLNNDVEILTEGWLEELVRQACRPDVGAVGACLLYPNLTVQHAGIVLNMTGLAGHVFRRSPFEAPSIGGPPYLVREVTAVTGACLAVRRETFERAGGFDEEHLPVNYNDVDFCLRLRSMGLRNIYTPFARLLHHESSSRRLMEDTDERKASAMNEARVMLQRWPREFAGDRHFNPNLALHTEIPVYTVPRIIWPWVDGRRHGHTPT